MIRAHIIRLDPTAEQEIHFKKCIGTARFAYNWGLAQWKERYTNGEKPSEGFLRKHLNSIKRDEFPWMLEVSKSVVQQAIKNLGSAYGSFFSSLNGTRKGRKYRLPVFKAKRASRQTARLDNGPGSFEFAGKSIKLQKIGTIKTHEELRLTGRALSVTLVSHGDRWWVSILVEIADKKDEAVRPAVGVDLGVKSALTLSDGTVFKLPTSIKRGAKSVQRLCRRLSRKKKGSNNRVKARTRLARKYWHVAQIRKDWQHKTTTTITKRYGLVGIEDLNVSGLLKNHRLARAISDVGFFEIRRQIAYKAQTVFVVSRWLPSSKTCSKCGCKKDSISLSARVFHCNSCGLVMDRDVNAANNILTASYAGINACGDGSSGPSRKTRTKLPSTKQESRLPVRA